MNDDDEGRGFCSRINGIGPLGNPTRSVQPAASVYDLQVRASTHAQNSADGQFDDRLVVAVRSL